MALGLTLLLARTQELTEPKLRMGRDIRVQLKAPALIASPPRRTSPPSDIVPAPKFPGDLPPVPVTRHEQAQAQAPDPPQNPAPPSNSKKRSERRKAAIKAAKAKAKAKADAEPEPEPEPKPEPEPEPEPMEVERDGALDSFLCSITYEIMQVCERNKMQHGLD